MNINDKLADKDGKLLEGMSPDRLHLSAKGYQVWADALKPILSELLGPPAKQDLAPPPTGDPRAASRTPAPAKDDPTVTEVPEAIVKKFKLDTTFYKKHLDYKGFSILSSAKVSDEALLEARYLIDRLLGDRDDILKAMIKRGCRFMVMAPTEMTTDVPEQRHMKDDPKTDWDKRARGLGGKLSSCGEENLLNLRGDRYNQENILIHEFNHAVHQQGLREVDPTFGRRLRDAYQAAMDKGLWKGTYVATNPSEYWAEGVQAYFDCMRRSSAPTRGRNFRSTTRGCSSWWTRSTSNLSTATSGMTSASRIPTRGRGNERTGRGAKTCRRQDRFLRRPTMTRRNANPALLGEAARGCVCPSEPGASATGSDPNASLTVGSEAYFFATNSLWVTISPKSGRWPLNRPANA